MSIVLDTTITALGFAACAALAMSALTYFGELRPARQKANRRMELRDSGVSAEVIAQKLISRPNQAAWTKGFVPGDLYDSADRWCRQAGPEVTLAKVALWMGAAWLGVVVLVATLSANLGPGAFAIGVFGGTAVICAMAFVIVSKLRQKRLRMLEEQLPTAIDLMVRALRAGHPVVAAIRLASEEMADPIGTELGMVVDETTYGVEFRVALASLAQRTELEDYSFLAVSVSIQAETGGNLAEILSNLGSVIRARFMLEKKVKALASEGKMSAIVLSVLPVLMIGGIATATPEYYSDVWHKPVFLWVVCGVTALYFFGLYLIHRITNFKY
jgi:tight adherence protein B